MTEREPGGHAHALGDAAHRHADVPLARYSGVGIGGPADLLVIARDRDTLVRAVRLAQEAGVCWRVFGGLTNMLLPDAGLRGWSFSITPAAWTTTQRRSGNGRIRRHHRQSGAGDRAQRLGRIDVGGGTARHGRRGGGEQCRARSAGKSPRTLVSAEVLTPAGNVQTVGPDWFAFQYRYSKLKAVTGTAEIVVSATFQLTPRDPAALAAKAAEYTERRQRTQPPGRTLGSTFKNPPGDYAGRLIEAAGLKGTRRGGCVISEQHANFFMNDGSGTAADYQALIDLAQAEVERQFGVRLEPEIEIVEPSAISGQRSASADR